MARLRTSPTSILWNKIPLSDRTPPQNSESEDGHDGLPDRADAEASRSHEPALPNAKIPGIDVHAPHQTPQLNSSSAPPAHPSPSSEPPIVYPQVIDPPRVGSSGGGISVPILKLQSVVEDWLGTSTYGAPRVFDLFTLLAVTLAFALLFAFMRFIEPVFPDTIPEISLALASFLTLTAIAQMVLWGGKKPRLASLVAGPINWILVAVILAVQAPRLYTRLHFSLGVLCSAVLGIFVGYLMGGLVAGVFLLADQFRRRFASNTEETSNETTPTDYWSIEDESE